LDKKNFVSGEKANTKTFVMRTMQLEPFGCVCVLRIPSFCQRAGKTHRKIVRDINEHTHREAQSVRLIIELTHTGAPSNKLQKVSL